MSWSNVKLILAREIRDQLRDRRTLFMIAVLPLLLYPLLGMSFFQISQFMREQPTSVLIVGAKELEGIQPPLIENKRFSGALFDSEQEAELLKLDFQPDEPRPGAASVADPWAEACRAVDEGKYDAALRIPPEYADSVKAVRRDIGQRAEIDASSAGARAQHQAQGVPPIPDFDVKLAATEKSGLTFKRLMGMTKRWKEALVHENLVAGGVPLSAVEPFNLNVHEPEESSYDMAIWAKLLPVMLLLWALTGAFYPAVDLCAGEKERGTLETLLSSPAERSEIVLGKLVTVMLFSMVTAVLNLAAIGITGWLLLSQLPGIGTPPLISIVWLLIALVPVSALFSALCLALAAFARSTKEGQYYLMPLLLVTMPLAILPIAPNVELNLGTSLIPVTGVVLLLRAALEGNYWQALQFLPPVLGVTLAGCLIAIRWAVDQFNSESVLFSESERLDLGLWMRHLMQDRQPTPTVAAAVFCGVTILVVKFFMSFALAGVKDFAVQAAFTQLVVVATPALLMTAMFTNSPRQTLILRPPRWLAIPAAVLLAVLLHPAIQVLQAGVMKLYPLSSEIEKALGALQETLQHRPILAVLLVVAVLPAVCEELAFRGFILSGLRHTGHKWRAIVITAVFFGVTHSILQQSIITCLVGVVLGYLAVQTGSILPCMVYHFCHNGLALLTTRITPDLVDRFPALQVLLARAPDGPGYVYHTPVVVLGGVAALAILYWFSRLQYVKSPEEELQESIDRGSQPDDQAWVAQADPKPAAQADPKPAAQHEGDAAPCPAPGAKA